MLFFSIASAAFLQVRSNSSPSDMHTAMNMFGLDGLYKNNGILKDVLGLSNKKKLENVNLKSTTPRMSLMLNSLFVKPRVKITKKKVAFEVGDNIFMANGVLLGNVETKPQFDDAYFKDVYSLLQAKKLDKRFLGYILSGYYTAFVDNVEISNDEFSENMLGLTAERLNMKKIISLSEDVLGKMLKKILEIPYSNNNFNSYLNKCLTYSKFATVDENMDFEKEYKNNNQTTYLFLMKRTLELLKKMSSGQSALYEKQLKPYVGKRILRVKYTSKQAKENNNTRPKATGGLRTTIVQAEIESSSQPQEATTCTTKTDDNNEEEDDTTGEENNEQDTVEIENIQYIVLGDASLKNKRPIVSETPVVVKCCPNNSFEPNEFYD
ncbi:hypothetical protein SLOPH_492 [Spraguea lophii 42_110]|uniref:Uncharacterized protein n=1 Tax=Spraguea lophii (strain 42_110) TaxID=1358809 RepID=S7W965_SPRLO|nr:hypothetical protein SLOPH_492 [Spraguea lophii 42_110]